MSQKCLCIVAPNLLACVADYSPQVQCFILHCVQKKTPTRMFFHISVNDVWI